METKTVLYVQSQSKQNGGEKLAGVQEIARKLRWHVRVVEGLPKPRALAALIQFWKPVGAIVECGGTAARLDEAQFAPLPVVFFDHDPSYLPPHAFCSTHDSRATGQMAARELMMGGATHFAYVPYPEPRFWSDERARGFTEALAVNGYGCALFGGKPSKTDPTRYQSELRAFLSALPKPCALFAANDWTAAEVLVAADFAPVNVPDELSVIGVDNLPDICEKTQPSLTSIKPDFRLGGRTAALLLAARLKDRAHFKGARRLTFGPLQVVRRASTRILAAPDRAVSEALDLIRKEACSGLRAETVLARFGCSRRNAELRFRKATGHSVLDEIHDVQLARAKELLSRHDMPLKLISDFCGFEHPNSLRKFFKAREGRTMGEFRAALRAGGNRRAQPAAT